MVLDVTIEDLTFIAYVVISEPDINLIADFVPQEHFENGGDLHVTAVEVPADAQTQIQDMTFNMNIGDSVVFLCSDEASYRETLEELGQDAYQDRA
ncbi:MAG: hypothetical protein KA735_00810 [Burkholderiaceae bacterium]|nr:hypothetical protein [Burkholderiaceae bacterium]